MRIFKFTAWTAVFLALLIGINSLLDFLLVPNQYARVKVHEIENVTYQDLILGTSHGASALDPEVLSAVTGRTTYNAAMGGEYTRDSYYILKDAVESGHKPERVIYEFDATYLTYENSLTENEAYIFYVMKPSATKLKYFLRVFWGEDFRWTFCRWRQYLDYTDRIAENVADKTSEVYRNYGVENFTEGNQKPLANGFIEIADEAGGNTAGASVYGEDAGLREDNIAALSTLITYCQEQSIEFVAVTTPIPDRTIEASAVFYQRADEQMSAYFASMGVAYFDYNYLETDRSDAAFSDGEGHMIRSAAKEFSAAFAAQLG